MVFKTICVGSIPATLALIFNSIRCRLEILNKTDVNLTNLKKVFKNKKFLKIKAQRSNNYPLFYKKYFLSGKNSSFSVIFKKLKLVKSLVPEKNVKMFFRRFYTFHKTYLQNLSLKKNLKYFYRATS